jgi:phosphoribosylaminoimidazole carboxylase (NCAIR synthetase)
VLAIPRARLHLYGKASKPGRKVGHVTLVGETRESLAADLAAVASLALRYVGVLALELFQVGDEFLANEMAPRVHNEAEVVLEASGCRLP